MKTDAQPSILQTIAGFGAQSGGTSTCTYELLTAMHRAKCDVDLMTLLSPDLMGDGEAWIRALPNDSVSSYGYSRNMNRFLRQSDYDLYHTNGMWMHCNHATCLVARKKGKPYVITPHGMLYPDALRRSYWKKWPLIQLFFRKDVNKATCLHVTCRQEMEHVRRFGFNGPIAVIPNTVTIPSYAETLSEETKQAFMGCSRPRKLGFLGRLHPIKKVENLLYGVSALAAGGKRDCELIIMGKGDEQYERFLHEEVERLGLTNVTFMGFVSGRQKYERLAELSALFVPSDFENFGMIVTEALAVGTPVMASLGTPWEELNSCHCGWWVDRSPDNIASVMKQVVEMPYEQLIEMGKNGRRLILERYTAKKIASQMARLYEWIVSGGERPEFVYV